MSDLFARKIVENELSPTAIQNLAAQQHQNMVGLRRYLHLYPELSWEEMHTAQVVADRLRALGLMVKTDVAGHGIIAHLKGDLPGAVVACRAEMDALPINDTLMTPYRSSSLGVKHACGHDAHMAISVGVAAVLSQIKNRLPGTIRFLFQPAEEALDGAQAMLAEGALDPPVPRALLAMHAFPLPVKTIGLTPGCCLPGMEEFRIQFTASENMVPELVNHALATFNSLNTQRPPETLHAFKKIACQMAAGDAALFDNFYLSSWSAIGGCAGEAHITGLVSASDQADRHIIHQRLRQALDSVVACADATYDMWISFTNPPVMNDVALTERLRPYVTQVIGDSNVVWFRAPYPFAHEDFALYGQVVPSALLWLGTSSPEKGIQSLLHTADYDIDEDALVTGTAVMSYLLLKLAQDHAL